MWLKQMLVVALCYGTTSASIVVSDYSTVALTNAFAPLSQSQFFAKQTLINISPAVADVAGDWTGTNFGGSIDTWRWVGSGHASISTTSAQASLTITGNGSFNREMTTSADFISPSNQAVLYAPGSAASYGCSFTVDTPSAYSLSGVLSRYSRFQLYSFTQSVYLYDKFNNSSFPFSSSIAGVLPAGDYSVGASTGLAGTGEHGAFHELYSGGFSNFLFTVQVPEPAGGMAIALAGGMLLRRRRSWTCRRR